MGLIFGLQVADTKGRGGIVTAVRHYARMFDAVDVPSACLYRGPAIDQLRSEGMDVMEAPSSLKHLWGRVLPQEAAAGREIRARAAGRAILAVVHSDLALPAIRHMLPNAVVVTPCHSDKVDRKRHADLVVTLNPVQHRLVSTALAGSRPRVAMLGNPFVLPLPSPLPRPPGPVRINFCGRFTDIKNPLLLMRAAALLKTRPLPELRFIGEGPLEAALREAAGQLARQIPIKVTFPGWVANPLEDFHRGDVLAVTSTWEGAPYLLQEALDAEIPIISSANQGSQYVLCDGAYGALYPPDDAAALACAIDAAAADPEALRLRTILGRMALHAHHGAAPFWGALRGALQTAAARYAADSEITARLTT